MTSRCFIALLSSIIFLSPIHAQSLLEIYDKAKKEDTIFLSAYQSLLSFGEKIPQARSLLLPTLNLNANSSQQKGRSSFNNESYEKRNMHSWGATLQLTQPLFRTQNWIGYKQAQWQVKQAEADFLKAKQELALRVVQAYFDALIAKDAIDVFKVHLVALEQQLEATKKNYQAGVTTITDVHEAKSRLELTTVSLVVAKKEYEDKKSIVEQIIGGQVEKFDMLAVDATILRPVPQDITKWTDNAIKNSPAVLFQKASFEVAEYEIVKNRSAHLPTMDLVASYGDNYSSGSITSPSDIKTRYQSEQIGVQLSMPIFTGGATHSKVQESQINFIKAKFDLEGAKRASIASTKQAYHAVESGIEQIKILTSAVENSKKSVASNKLGYKIGVRINNDVLNAEQQLASTKRELTKTKYETLLYGLRLKASSGILSDDDIAEIDKMLIEK